MTTNTPQPPDGGRATSVFRAAVPKAADLLLPFLVSVGILLLVGTDVAFLSSIPANSDLTGHLFAPEVLRTELLTNGRIRGWSLDWFGGFPVYYFYFPLPGVAAAVLSFLFDPGLAVRLVALAAPLSMPWALHAYGRSTGLGRWKTMVVVAVGSTFLLTTSFEALGGNLVSTINGEFAYGWAFSFTLLYLAVLGRTRPRQRDGIMAGALLAGSVLSHVLPPIAAVAAAAPLLLVADRRRVVLQSWVVAGGLAAFWVLPMVLRIDQISNPGWDYVPRLGELLPAEIYLLIPIAAVGVWLTRSSRLVWLIGIAGLVGLMSAAVPQTLIMRGRLLPFWAFAVHIFAGVGLGGALSLARVHKGWAAAAVILGLGPWVTINVLRNPAEIHAFSARTLEGIEAQPGAAELRGLIHSLQELPPGRVHWEDSPDLWRWGGRFAFSLIPYWTDHAAMKGLFAESSPTADVLWPLDRMLAHERNESPTRSEEEHILWDPERGVAVMRELGVRYFVAISEATADVLTRLPGVRALTRHGRLRLFDLGQQQLVTVLSCGTEPPAAGVPFRRSGLQWLESWRPGAAWPVRDGVAVVPGLAGCTSTPMDESISGIEVLSRRIRFQTAALGVPHLVRVSYFPNWSAQGARGPYLAAPWFMVVVPDDNEVELKFGLTWVELLGWLVTGLAVLGLLAQAWRARTPRGDDTL